MFMFEIHIPNTLQSYCCTWRIFDPTLFSILANSCFASSVTSTTLNSGSMSPGTVWIGGRRERFFLWTNLVQDLNRSEDAGIRAKRPLNFQFGKRSILNKNTLIAHPCEQLECSPLPRELWSRCPTQDSTSLRRNWASSKTFAFPPSSTFSPERCSRLALPPALSSYPPGYWRAEEGVGEAGTFPGASWRGRCPWWRWQAGPGSSSGGSRGSGSSGMGSRSCGRLPTGCRMSPLSLWLSWVRESFNCCDIILCFQGE